jgi:hypothetical protein
VRPKPGTTFVHRHKLDPTWTPGPGQRYRHDAPHAECVVTATRGDTVYYGYANTEPRGRFSMTLANWEEHYT